MEWRTIDSAPKDGKRVLGYDPMQWEGEQVSTTYCDSRGKWRQECKITATAWDQYEYEVWEPTHWVPLEPPKEKSND